MSSALLARPYLNGQWQFVEDGAQSAGRVANRREWRIARDIFVGPTPTVARQRAIDNCVNILMDLETGF